MIQILIIAKIGKVKYRCSFYSVNDSEAAAKRFYQELKNKAIYPGEYVHYYERFNLDENYILKLSYENFSQTN